MLTNYVALAACMAVATVVGDIWRPLKLIGATAASGLAFFFPAAVVLSLGRAGAGGALYATGWALAAVGVVQACVGVASQFF